MSEEIKQPKHASDSDTKEEKSQKSEDKLEEKNSVEASKEDTKKPEDKKVESEVKDDATKTLPITNKDDKAIAESTEKKEVADKADEGAKDADKAADKAASTDKTSSSGTTMSSSSIDRIEARRAKEKKKQSFQKKIAAGVAAAIVVGAIATFGVLISHNSPASSAPESEQAQAMITSFDGDVTPDVNLSDSAINPIDFLSLMERNSDVYAWLYVPGTKVNEPIMQSALADNYYLYHNLDGEEDMTGVPYTQAKNSKRFTDSVTLVYGHTFQTSSERADEAFGTLHNYEKDGFIDENPYFYIFTTSGMYKYKIVSAYLYDDRHILNSFDFGNMDVLQEYFNYVKAPNYKEGTIASDISDIDLTAGKSRIVQLSTCTPYVSDDRYLVTGMLVDITKLTPSWR